jgi:hypothetical protein
VRKILNPRSLLNGRADGIAAANGICARCHTKGESVGTLPGTAETTQFGFDGAAVAQAGDPLAEFLRPTSDPDDFWGAKSNPLPSVPGDTTLAARSDRQQAQDVDAGVHAPTSPFVPTCFDCHDPHVRGDERQIARRVDHGFPVATRADDNSLCLACHAGVPPFTGMTKEDAAEIQGGKGPPQVAQAVVDHMSDVGMPVPRSAYDPRAEGPLGVGRCTTCHMPRTPSSGPRTADRGGYAAGALHGHRFETVWPNASELHGVTNSCHVCHPTGEDDPVGPILLDWARPQPGRTSFHGASPPTSQDGIPLNGAMNPMRDGGVRCIACHTSEGFVRLQVRGLPVTQAETDRIAKRSVARDRGVTCDACHGSRADGEFHGEDRNPLRLPEEALCVACHNAATILFEDFRDHGAVVRHPQREMIDGTAGATPPGAPPTATTSHSFLPGGCSTCHYDQDRGVERHHFLPDAATCGGCHVGLATFDRPAAGDWDGDGAVAGIQTEVAGLLGLVQSALLADPRISFSGGRYDYDAATDHALAGASEAQKRAAFNWYSVEDDGSLGVHNAARAVQLLQGSYRELTGSDVPGAAIR